MSDKVGPSAAYCGFPHVSFCCTLEHVVSSRFGEETVGLASILSLLTWSTDSRLMTARNYVPVVKNGQVPAAGPQSLLL